MVEDLRTQTFEQNSKYASPWTFKQRVVMLIWNIVWASLCRWTPKPLNAWRIFWLARFGCQIHGKPFVHQNAKITIPWNLTLDDRACLGDGATAYSLGRIVIGEGCTIAQEAYLCTGTHDFSSPEFNLVVKEIRIGKNAFVGARAFILPGVDIGDEAIVGACAVVTKNVGPKTIVAGNPAKPIANR